jgi:PKHD-type hydroxylase
MSYNYKTIVNNTTERSKYIYPWCYWDGIFNEEDLKKMCDYFDHHGVERGTTIGPVDPETKMANGAGQKNEEVRRSHVKFHLKNNDTAWFFDKINFGIELINNNYYNFDLNGYDMVQYTEYESEELGKYDFHIDTIMDINTGDCEMRKLSLTILLNKPGIDFEGGNFEINNGNESSPLIVDARPGRIIAFPSFMIHRVAPITKGKRKSLVVWVLGPKFR